VQYVLERDVNSYPEGGFLYMAIGKEQFLKIILKVLQKVLYLS